NQRSPSLGPWPTDGNWPPCAQGDSGLASKLARSGEGCPVLVDKCFERRRRPTTNRFDQVVLAGEDPVLMVDGDLAQVLDEERIPRPAVWGLFNLAVQRSGVGSGRRLCPPEVIIWSMVSMLTLPRGGVSPELK